MKTVATDFIVGVLSSTAVLLLDRLGLFQGIVGTHLLELIHEYLGVAGSARFELWGAIAAFALGFLGSRMARGRSRVSRGRGNAPFVVARGAARIPERAATYHVYYPVLFAKTPHLNVRASWAEDFEIVSQRPDGFDVRIGPVFRSRGLLLEVLIDRPSLRWEAEGPVAEE